MKLRCIHIYACLVFCINYPFVYNFRTVTHCPAFGPWQAGREGLLWVIFFHSSFFDNFARFEKLIGLTVTLQFWNSLSPKACQETILANFQKGCKTFLFVQAFCKQKQIKILFSGSLLYWLYFVLLFYLF